MTEARTTTSSTRSSKLPYSEAARLHSIVDAQQAVQHVTGFFSAVEDALARIAEMRHRAVIELYEEPGATYQSVADLTGLSKTRVGVLVREAQGHLGL